MPLTAYIPLFDAVVTLFSPLAEVVIHDLSSQTICYINGSLSKRQVGDPSLLVKEEIEEVFPSLAYPKIGFDGRLIKSISILVEDRWLICLNCDVSIFKSLQHLSDSFLNVSQNKQPQSLFKNDWQEKVHLTVHDYLQEKGWSFEALRGSQKKELINYLFESGAFQEKNAADYVATILHMGRATIFNYLKEWRKK